MNKIFLAGTIKTPAVTETFNNFTKTTVVIECKEYFSKNGCVDYKSNLIPIEFFGNSRQVVEGLKENDVVMIQGKISVRSYLSKAGTEVKIVSVVGEYAEIISKSHTHQSNKNNIVDDKIPF